MDARRRTMEAWFRRADEIEEDARRLRAEGSTADAARAERQAQSFNLAARSLTLELELEDLGAS